MIESVILKIGKLIEKPKMTEKLLSKPPFRFLHDTITAIINQSSSTTSFGKGLYSKNESDSSMVTEKQSKIDYLDKIISLVGICKVKCLKFKNYVFH